MEVLEKKVTLIDGDWNTVTESNGKNSLNPKQWTLQADSIALNLALTKYQFKDSWSSNPTKQTFGHTFLYRYQSVSSRIDRWIFATGFHFQQKSCYVNYSTGNISDHYPIISNFSSNNKVERGIGYWKMNNSLLSHIDIKNSINNIWKEAEQVYFHCKNIECWWENTILLISTL